MGIQSAYYLHPQNGWGFFEAKLETLLSASIEAFWYLYVWNSEHVRMRKLHLTCTTPQKNAALLLWAMTKFGETWEIQQPVRTLCPYRVLKVTPKRILKIPHSIFAYWWKNNVCEVTEKRANKRRKGLEVPCIYEFCNSGRDISAIFDISTIIFLATGKTEKRELISH